LKVGHCLISLFEGATMDRLHKVIEGNSPEFIASISFPPWRRLLRGVPFPPATSSRSGARPISFEYSGLCD
jgi:hypothetical protein